MNNQQTKQAIVDALHSFSANALTESAINLFNSMGYASEKCPAQFSSAPSNFINDFDSVGKLNTGKALFGQWQSEVGWV